MYSHSLFLNQIPSESSFCNSLTTFIMRALALPAALLLAASSLVSASDDTIPMQVRLAYAGDTGMMVSWNTYSQLEWPTVYYGTRPNDLRQSAYSDVSVTYPTSTTYNNHVEITGLQPDTLYYYQPQNSNSSQPYTFKTSRPAGDMTPYTIAVVVDLGTMGPEGLTTYVGNGAANPLLPGEKTPSSHSQTPNTNGSFCCIRATLHTQTTG